MLELHDETTVRLTIEEELIKILNMIDKYNCILKITPFPGKTIELTLKNIRTNNEYSLCFIFDKQIMRYIYLQEIRGGFVKEIFENAQGIITYMMKHIIFKQQIEYLNHIYDHRDL